VDSATASRVTPLREPEVWRSWEERQLTAIIARAYESAVDNAILYRRLRLFPEAAVLTEVYRYLDDAMAWFLAVKDQADDPGPPWADGPFEHWLIERWLKEIRSEAFRDSADYEYLRARWEREG
jgi:hypothetical protein